MAKTEQLHFRVTAAFKASLRRLARRRGVSMSALALDVLSNYVEVAERVRSPHDTPSHSSQPTMPGGPTAAPP